MYKSILYIFIIIFNLIKYEKLYANISHGNIIINSQVNKLKIGKTNKNDVIFILGNPSIIDIFTNKIWFYIHFNIINNKIENLKKLTLYFDDNDILIKIKNNISIN